MPESNTDPPNEERARNPRKLLGALRVVLTLLPLLYRLWDDYGSNDDC